MTEQPKEPMHDQLNRALPDQPELAPALSESVNEALTRHATLEDIGAHEDAMGEHVIPNAKVVLYDVFGEWEIDIYTTNGSIHFAIPIGKVSVTYDNSHAHFRAVGRLRYLLRDYSRDELLSLMDEAEAESDYDIDGWPLDHGRPSDWPDTEGDTQP